MSSSIKSNFENVSIRSFVLALVVVVFCIIYNVLNAIVIPDQPDYLFNGFGGGFQGFIFVVLAFVLNPFLGSNRRRYFGAMLLFGSSFFVIACVSAYMFFTWKGGGLPTESFRARLWICGILMCAAVFFAVVLALWRIRPFSLGELIVILVVPTMCLSMTSGAMSQYLLPQIARTINNADPANRWDNYTDILPKNLKPNLEMYPDAAEHFTIGASADGLKEVFVQHGEEMWYAWWKMLSVWTVYFALLFLICFCVASILRKQFIEKELLDYPLLRAQLEMMKAIEPKKDQKALLGGGLFWLAFILTIVLISMKPIHLRLWGGKMPVIGDFLAAIPVLNTSITGGNIFSNKPWNLLNRTIFVFNLDIIALFYLIPLQASFSLWFFYLLNNKALPIIGTALGHNVRQSGSNTHYEFVKNQSMGSILTMAAFALWAARKHLSDVFRKAFVGASDVDDSDEFTSYRFAVWGLIIGFVALVGWSAWNGISWYYAIFLFSVYILIIVFYGKLLGEMTLPHCYPELIPHDWAFKTIGKANVADGNIATGGVAQYAHMREQYNVLTNMLMSFKLMATSKINRRQVSLCLLVAFIIGIPLCHFGMLSTCYWMGLETNLVHHHNSFLTYNSTRIVEAMESTDTAKKGDITWIGVGSIMTGAFVFLRQRFLWWPLHPLGYAVSSSGWMFQVWFSFFLAWAAKLTVISVGGSAAYRKSLYVVFGVILGNMVCGTFWMLVRLVYYLCQAPWTA
ncbi:DUF6785 family protein [Candidatus Hydrogenedentota bacterium]